MITTLTITLPDDRRAKLHKLVERLRVTPEELATTSITELLTRTHETFQQALSYVSSLSRSSQPGRILDEELGGAGQDRIMAGVPRHPEVLGDPGHRHAVNDHRLHRQRDRVTRQLAAGRRCFQVMAPSPSAWPAPVARC